MSEKKDIFLFISVIILLIAIWTMVGYFIFNTEYIKQHPCEICESKYNETCYSGRALLFNEYGIPRVIEFNKNINLTNFSLK